MSNLQNPAWDNQERRRYYGKRIGDTVKIDLFYQNRYLMGTVIDYGSGDNNRLVVKLDDGNIYRPTAEHCEIITRVEDKDVISLKALSIKNPYAFLIAAGIKDIENRSQPTKHRGKIFIHATAKAAGTIYEILTLPQLDFIRLVNDKIGETEIKYLLDWIIQGGESGHHKRPFNLDWAYAMQKECAALEIPYFFKQIDKIQPVPENLMQRQFPGFYEAISQVGCGYCSHNFRIRTNRKDGTEFLACSNYPNCKNTKSIPVDLWAGLKVGDPVRHEDYTNDIFTVTEIDKENNTVTTAGGKNGIWINPIEMIIRIIPKPFKRKK